MILIIAAMFSRDAQEREKRRGLTVHLIYTSLQDGVKPASAYLLTELRTLDQRSGERSCLERDAQHEETCTPAHQSWVIRFSCLNEPTEAYLMMNEK
ncbi:uncharacterized [Tachysurus ichikawai]